MTYALDNLLLHGSNLICVDKILHKTSDCIQTCVKLKNDHPLMQDGFLPSYAYIELMAQTIAVMAGYNFKEANLNLQMSLLVGARNVHFYKPQIRAEENLKIQANLKLASEEGFGIFDCQIHDKQSLIAKASLNVFSPILKGNA